MLQIGMIGPLSLLRQNYEILRNQAEPADAFPLRTAQQLQNIDGLLITGCRPEDYANQLYRFRSPVKSCADHISLLGIAAGAAALSEHYFLSLLHCQTRYHFSPRITTSILEVPVFSDSRFSALFMPDIQFSSLAPNLGILCQHPHRGPVIIRQGDILVCSYMAEWTAQKEIYRYWLEMVTALKNSREF